MFNCNAMFVFMSPGTRDDSLRGPTARHDAQTMRNVQSFADLHNQPDPTPQFRRGQLNRVVSPRAATLGGRRTPVAQPMTGPSAGTPAQQQSMVPPTYVIH